jgi:hypothetical protein
VVCAALASHHQAIGFQPPESITDWDPARAEKLGQVVLNQAFVTTEMPV